jgi:hypothetical protein
MPPYQGARAQTAAKETRRVFAISKVRLDRHGRIAEVLWAEVNAKSNLSVSAAVQAPVSEVVDAIHAGHDVVALFPTMQAPQPERPFVIVDHDDGVETIAFDGPDVPGRDLRDIVTFDRQGSSVDRTPPKVRARHRLAP